MSVPKSNLNKRGGVYYLHYFQGAAGRRVSLRTTSFHVAKEKQRQFGSARARDEEPLFPTRTPTARVVQGYVKYISTTTSTRP